MELGTIPTDDLIEELKQRGLAIVLAMAEQDPEADLTEPSVVHYWRGNMITCLGLARLLNLRIEANGFYTYPLNEDEEYQEF